MTTWYADGAVAPECWVSIDGGQWKQAKDLLESGGNDGGDSKDSSSSTKITDSSGPGLNPNSQWYMLIEDENHGPYTTEEMKMWYSDGSVAPECWVSVDGGEWKQASDALSGEGDINFDLKVVFVNSSSMLSKPVFPFSIPLIAFCNDSAKLLPIAITSPTDFI